MENITNKYKTISTVKTVKDNGETRKRFTALEKAQRIVEQANDLKSKKDMLKKAIFDTFKTEYDLINESENKLLITFANKVNEKITKLFD